MKWGSRYEVIFAARLRAEGLPEPELQYRFAPPRRFRFDFAWPEKRVAAEVDGGARLVRWQRNPRTGAPQPVAVGRHGTASDYEKLNLASSRGWRVFRFNPDLLKRSEALEELRKALE